MPSSARKAATTPAIPSCTARGNSSSTSSPAASCGAAKRASLPTASWSTRWPSSPKSPGCANKESPWEKTSCSAMEPTSSCPGTAPWTKPANSAKGKTKSARPSAASVRPTATKRRAPDCGSAICLTPRNSPKNSKHACGKTMPSCAHSVRNPSRCNLLSAITSPRPKRCGRSSPIRLSGSMASWPADTASFSKEPRALTSTSTTARIPSLPVRTPRPAAPAPGPACRRTGWTRSSGS